MNTHIGIIEGIKELENLKKPIKRLFFKGNKELLHKDKISIVGSRKATDYSKESIFELTSFLSKNDICIVSGAAIGIDTQAHKGAKAHNTIAVMGNSLDIIYPAINKNLITDIQNNGLVLSQYAPTFRATRYSFVQRNQIVVALGKVLVIGECEQNSGSMRSAEFAIKMNKDIYVLMQRANQSSGTKYLLQNNFAKPIYDFGDFLYSVFGKKPINDKEEIINDDFLHFCSKSPTYEEAFRDFGDKLFEYELNGKIEIKNGIVRVV